jgi:acetyltransferase-like isoleucine patch superfamily enzyme
VLSFIKILSINPITKWLQWLVMRHRLIKNNKTLSVGYMSIIFNSTFSIENHIFPFARLVNTHLGNFTYVGGNTSIKNAKVGHFCSIASDCKIGLGIHPTDFVSTHPAFYAPKKEWSIHPNEIVSVEEYQEIIIGNDVWIGTNAIIVDGVAIGNGAIVAANAVVTKDVPPYAIVGGVPAKIIKFRFQVHEINQLESIKWWDWEIDMIKKNISKFKSLNSFLDD